MKLKTIKSILAAALCAVGFAALPAAVNVVVSDLEYGPDSAKPSLCNINFAVTSDVGGTNLVFEVAAYSKDRDAYFTDGDISMDGGATFTQDVQKRYETAGSPREVNLVWRWQEHNPDLDWNDVTIEVTAKVLGEDVAVKCQNGTFVGVRDSASGVVAFKSVPYAKPPTKETGLRWKPPVKPDDSDAVFSARHFGPAAAQTRSDGEVSSYGPLSEDCLKLSIWTADGFTSDTKRPVMFFIHGGSYGWGGMSDPLYDGDRLVRDNPDVILVSCDYRVNAFGYLDLTGLPGYDPEKHKDYDQAPNLGILDLQAGLRWVKENIVKFGGDPDQVTIFGESAGGGSVSCLLQAKGSEGLFKRAIVMSGTVDLTDLPETYRDNNQAYCMMKAAGKSSIDELLECSTDELIAALSTPLDDPSVATVRHMRPREGGPLVAHLNNRPMCDDVRGIVPSDPFAAFATNAIARNVDVMIGTTSEELNYWATLMFGISREGTPSTEDPLGYYYCSFLSNWINRAESFYARVGNATAIPTFLEGPGSSHPFDSDSRYNLGERYPNIWGRTELASELSFRIPSIIMAEQHIEQVATLGGTGKTYMYYFCRPWKSEKMPWKGACHACELTSVFKTLNLDVDGTNEVKKTLADNVSGAFVAFAKTGNPGEKWATYDTTERKTTVIGKKGDFEDAELRLESDPDSSQRELLQADYLKYREAKLRTGDMPVYAHDLRPIKPYLHEIWYDNYEDSDLTGYDAPFLDLESQYHGGCSSVRAGNYHGRNLDIGISDTATIVVHMKAGEGRFASVGTSQWGDASETALQAGSVSDHRFDVLPNWMTDGINENGVAINVNVIPLDVMQEGADPDSDERPSLHARKVVRYVLDHAESAAGAIEDLKKFRIYGNIGTGTYNLHWMISDAEKTFVVEVIEGRVVAREHPIMTNFSLNWDNANKRAIESSEFASWSPSKYENPAKYSENPEEILNLYTRHAEGVERYIRLRDADYETRGRTFEGMFDLMREVQFTRIVELPLKETFLSDLPELAEMADAEIRSLTDIHAASNATKLAAVWETLQPAMSNVYANLADYRKPGAIATYSITTHNVTFDLKKKMFRIVVQEEYDEPFDFYLSPTVAKSVVVRAEPGVDYNGSTLSVKLVGVNLGGYSSTDLCASLTVEGEAYEPDEGSIRYDELESVLTFTISVPSDKVTVGHEYDGEVKVSFKNDALGETVVYSRTHQLVQGEMVECADEWFFDYVDAPINYVPETEMPEGVTARVTTTASFTGEPFEEQYLSATGAIQAAVRIVGDGADGYKFQFYAFAVDEEENLRKGWWDCNVSNLVPVAGNNYEITAELMYPVDAQRQLHTVAFFAKDTSDNQPARPVFLGNMINDDGGTGNAGRLGSVSLTEPGAEIILNGFILVNKLNANLAKIDDYDEEYATVAEAVDAADDVSIRLLHAASWKPTEEDIGKPVRFLNKSWLNLDLSELPANARAVWTDEDGNNGTLSLELAFADTVVYGTIRTAEEGSLVAEAIAVKDGKYVYVGDEAGVAPFVKDGFTKVVDHRGKGMVMPGCTDGHSHYTMKFGLDNMKGGVIFDDSDDKDAILEKLETAAQAAEASGKESLFGYGWDFATIMLGDKPTLAELDAATHGVSTVIFDSTVHNAFCNSECLKRCGIIDGEGNVLITEIDGGLLELDENGRPTGYANERVTGYLMRMGGINQDEIVDDEVAESTMRATQKLLLSTGYTMALEGWSNLLHPSKFYEAAHRMDTNGELKVVFPMTYEVEPWQTNMNEQIEYLAWLNEAYGTRHVLPSYLKVFMDGCVETMTGAIAKPYKDGTEYKSFWETNRLADITRDCNTRGLTVHIHAMGDAAVKEVTDAYIQGGDGTHRNCLVHLRNVRKEDFQRFAENNIACTAGMTWHVDVGEQAELMALYLDEEYIEHAYPMKSFFDAGVKVSSHSDFPANEGCPQDPFGIMYVAVTGLAPNPREGDEPYDADELITIEQAFQALTLNGAWQLGLEKERGSIKVGKWADFVLADQDVFACETTDIGKTKVVSTWFEGAKVYQASEFVLVTPGKALGPYDTAEEASNVLARAEFAPSAEVAEKLGGEGSQALKAYCDMFMLDVVPTADDKWEVAAFLKPPEWTNVVESAREATRQIPVADIAALPLGIATNVTVKGCGVPGFYYSLYSGSTVTNIREIVSDMGRNVLCGTDRDVEFEGVVKPSDEAGFFSIGVLETPTVYVGGDYHALTGSDSRLPRREYPR